ncbi:apolipophorins-like [Cyprinodon tularosa]|uniref:apolipophorins-like n=1 Tax=Cyprinodon tularosa TaxID=77115 RepID=UPI0018E1FF10|nr:apolipophorins-like [Cyprinodon tularosa]
MALGVAGADGARRRLAAGAGNEALLVADQFVVTFDGHLYELPGSCPLLLSQDVSSESFTLLLGTDPQSSLLILMNNSTISIQRTGQVKAGCQSIATHGHYSDHGLSVRKGSNQVQVSNQHGRSVSCDLQLELCSFTLDGWFHGASTGLLGTNTNDAGDDFPLPDGSQAQTLEDFFNGWKLNSSCTKYTETKERSSQAATRAASCESLFSSPDSLLSSCFRVVDPDQFLSVCKRSSSKAPCRLAAAFVHLCQENYIPLEIPGLCVET